MNNLMEQCTRCLEVDYGKVLKGEGWVCNPCQEEDLRLHGVMLMLLSMNLLVLADSEEL